MDSLPTTWASDLWTAAKTAGPLCMFLLCALVVVWRKLSRAEAKLLELTVAGITALNGVSAGLKNVEKIAASKRSGR